MGSPTIGTSFPAHRGDARPVVFAQPGAGRKPSGRWSKVWDRCCNCGRDDRKHAAHGYCQRCYLVSDERRRQIREAAS